MKLKIRFVKGTYFANDLIKLLGKKGVKPHITNLHAKQLRLFDDIVQEKQDDT